MASIFLPGQLSPKTRDLMIQVHDGVDGTLQHLYLMMNLYRVDEVLGWLVKNNCTGHSFLGLIASTFNGSLLETISYIIMRLNHDLEQKPIIVGRDIR